MIKDFTEWILSNKDETYRLQIFYNQPYRRRENSLYTMIKDVLEKAAARQTTFTPMKCLRAYHSLGPELVEGTLLKFTLSRRWFTQDIT